ncbi:hypothetical protein [Xylophilus ampelinus]|uniref:hypothetical protein n=1 Tax=Xylophilus ampelinus TaxID=54067 RepID=UPI0011B40B59|nr:hypothetical protein [Xylophilus ampelinus]MCS4511935.1 hypothetical protein [Xylophilus ampelinus]
MIQKICIFSIFLMTACGGKNDTVNVQILPSEYKFEEVKSTLATPVVDEVVRLKPKMVHISTCRSTPNSKLIQFNLELQARLDTKITSGFYKECPEN